jgi:hypothetical protein
MLQKDRDIDEDTNHRIKAGWIKWRHSGILCDKRVPQKLKDKFYRTAIRPAILYGAECWPTKRRHVQQLGMAEMRMLRWMCGHTRRDWVRNDDIRERVGVAATAEKLVQHRLRWFGHIQHRPPDALVHSAQLKRADNVKRGQGRPNLTWEEVRKKRSKGLEYHQRTSHGQGCLKACYPCAKPWVGCEILWVSPLAYPNLFGT